MLHCPWLVESVDGVELQIQRLPISSMRINPFVVQGSAVYGIGGEPLQVSQSLWLPSIPDSSL